MPHELFAADGLTEWDIHIDRSNAASMNATLTVANEQIRHTIAITGLEDDRMMLETFHGIRELRVSYYQDRAKQFCLEFWHEGEKYIDFPLDTFHVDTRSNNCN